MTLTTSSTLQNVLPTKGALPAIKATDFGLAKAADGPTVLRARPLTCHLFTLAPGWAPMCTAPLFFPYRRHVGCPAVTTKMATPTKVDSELTDAQLESCRRATEALEGLRSGTSH
jgi:hypothetical protein